MATEETSTELLRATQARLEAELGERVDVEAGLADLFVKLGPPPAPDAITAPELAPGDAVTITDASLNFGDLYGRSAVLKEIRDDADGYNYRVHVTDLHGLVTRGGKYETWVADVAPADHDTEK